MKKLAQKYVCRVCGKKGSAKAYENQHEGWVRIDITAGNISFPFIACPDHVHVLNRIVSNFLESPTTGHYVDIPFLTRGLK